MPRRLPSPLTSAVCLALSLAGGVSAQPGPARPIPSPDAQYEPGPDSREQPGVPRGATLKLTHDRSQVFPGTTRTITVYVPAQYDATRPACVYVGFDGLNFGAPAVFDNLIHRRELPVLIGIGISPGVVPSGDGKNPRFNRSAEFDGLSGSLARLVFEEVFPLVERQAAPDGRPIRLSRDGNDVCAAGGSTGAIAAFTLAWERPDAVRRVFSSVGTYVGMRGGDRYPVLVRKTEPKPIRIFLQDGSRDQWMGGPEVGDWWISNQAMQRALEFSGYEVRHVWGEGTHNGRHATMLFPDAMRWLWRDWPQPVTAAAPTQNTFLKAILEPGSSWQPLPGAWSDGTRLAADATGRIWAHDPAGTGVAPLDATDPAGFPGAQGPFSALVLGPDGRLYAADTRGGQLVAFAADGKREVILDDVRAADLLVTHERRIYAAEAGDGDAAGRLWLITPGRKQLLDGKLNTPRGLAVSPDGRWLAVAENRGHGGHSFRVESDGSLAAKQKIFWFHVPDTADDSGARAWRYDRDGRLYAATRMGVQVFDRNGRSRAILPLPAGDVTELCFGGSDFRTLYVVCGSRILRREFKVAGAPPWLPPIELPAWGPG